MSNLHLMALRAPVGSEKIGDEAAVTLFRTRFGAKERCALRPGSRVERLRNSALLHKGKKACFVGSPILRIAIGVEKVSRWRELRFVGIADGGNSLKEKLEVRIFGEAGELPAAVEADID